MSWVPARTLVTRCRLVCHRWKAIIDSRTIWKCQWERDPSKQDCLKAVRLFPQMEHSRLGILEPFGRNLPVEKVRPRPTKWPSADAGQQSAQVRVAFSD